MYKKFKRNILRLAATVTIALGSTAVFAQTHYSSNISFGAKGGMDFSRIFFSPNVRQSFQPGVNFGVMFRYIEENHFGLIAEVDFMQRGWKEDFQDTPYKYSGTLNYIQIPVLAHIYFGGRNKFFMNLGPEIGFRVGESRSSNFDVSEIGKLDDFPPNRTFYQWSQDANQKIDYGISAGLGYEFHFNKRNSLMLEGRFYYGIGNVFKTVRQEGFRASNQMTVSASIGYWFRFK